MSKQRFGHGEAGENFQRAARDKRALDLGVLRTVMHTPAGRRVLFRIIDEIAGLSSVSFTGNSETFYREGRRSVGVDLMREIQEACPQDYMTMLVEANNERIAASARLMAQENPNE
jgi:hypothetical protein